MAYTDIDDPSAYFTIALYTGTSDDSVKTVTNDANAGDFKPDWLWIKGRSGTYAAGRNHNLYDSSRGATKRLESNTSIAEATHSDNTFNTNGFTLTSDYAINGLNTNHVAWQWKCNGGTTASNTDGSITSTVQVNDDAGFSIVLYTGNETDNATIGHGLSAAPDVVIVKNRDTARTWLVGHSAYVNGGNSENMRLNSTMAVASASSEAGSGWSRTAFGSSVFTVGNGTDGDYTSSTNNGTDDHVAYCFRSIQGYSKFGSYVGNGVSNNGTFAYTGFSPSFVMIKNASSGASWLIFDNKRGATNMVSQRLYANDPQGEDTGTEDGMDFVSNGFKIRSSTGSSASSNASGSTYFYMAFASAPLVSSNGVPTTAR